MTNRTEYLCEVLISKFKPYCTNVYYEEGIQVGHEKKEYPFITFELSELGTTDGETKYVCEVNLIDYGKSKSSAEEIADKLQKALDFDHYIDDKIQYRCYKEGRNAVKEDDKLVIRRRLLFEINLNEVEGA